MGKRIFSEQDEQEILRLYKKRVSAKDICKRIGCCPPTLYRILKKYNISPRYCYAKYNFSREEEEDIIKMYQNREGYDKIKEKYGCGDWAVRSIVQKYGYSLHKSGGCLKTFLEEEIKDMINLWQEGESQYSIADRYKTTQQKISKVLKENLPDSEYRKRAFDSYLPKGGKIKHGQGYILILLLPNDPFIKMANSKGYIMEHRYVMAQHLDRLLDETETVHHINGIRNDNRIENLELRQGRHGKGVKYQCRNCGSQDVQPTKLGQSPRKKIDLSGLGVAIFSKIV